jgi:uncharacterized protein YlxW (UPF0749 family)
MAAELRRRMRPRRSVPEPSPQARMGLLDLITATSLDEDYAHASRRRAAGADRPGRPGGAALVVLLAFGLLVATAGIQTARSADESATSRAALVKQLNSRKRVLADERAQLQRLTAEVVAAQRTDLRATRTGRELQQRLTRLGLAAGTLPAKGPGIQVVVDDARGARSYQQQVQATDLVKLVNGLWQVGAEAIAINGQRLTSLSPIRDAADAITVGFSSLRRPYTVSAIGNRDTMGADLLDTAGGRAWVTLQSTFGLQFDVETKESMVLPAAKAPSLRSAHLPPRLRPDVQRGGRGDRGTG